MPGDGGEEEGGVHAGVEPRRVADAAGARARGVEHDDDAAVLLGLPRPHDEVAAPRGRPPVDGAHVVALDVVAQRVELRALPAGAHRRAPVELAQHGEPARDVPARRERVEHPQPPGHLERGLPRGDAERSAQAERHPVGVPVAAPRRGERRGEAGALTAGQAERVPGQLGSRGRRPRVAQQPDGPARCRGW